MRAFIKRFLMHYGIYRRYPLGRFPALRNAWRAAQPSDPWHGRRLGYPPDGIGDGMQWIPIVVVQSELSNSADVGLSHQSPRFFKCAQMSASPTRREEGASFSRHRVRHYSWQRFRDGARNID
jgi:hypothetical protein